MWYNALMPKLLPWEGPLPNKLSDPKVSGVDILPFGFDSQIEAYLLRCTINDKGCWNYPSLVGTAPQIWIDGKKQYLPRVVYTATNRELDSSKRVQHVCGNSVCVNPMHLIAVNSDFLTVRNTRKVERKIRRIREVKKNAPIR